MASQHKWIPKKRRLTEPLGERRSGQAWGRAKKEASPSKRPVLGSQPYELEQQGGCREGKPPEVQ